MQIIPHKLLKEFAVLCVLKTLLQRSRAPFEGVLAICDDEHDVHPVFHNTLPL